MFHRCRYQFQALVFIAAGIGGATLKLYTQVGLVTLIGLLNKHGILIVEVANAEHAAASAKRTRSSPRLQCGFARFS